MANERLLHNQSCVCKAVFVFHKGQFPDIDNKVCLSLTNNQVTMKDFFWIY
jgi:hypothetical protein